MQREKELIEQIDDRLEEILVAFTAFFSTKVNREIRKILEEFIDSWDNDRSIKGRLARVRVINRFRSEISRKLSTGVLKTAYEDLIDSYKELVTIGNVYFSLLSEKYDKQLYRQIYKDSIAYLKESLTGAGINKNVVTPLMDKIYEMNMRGVTKRELRSWLKDYLETRNVSGRHAEQVAVDALYQMTSYYQNQIAADLNIQHWYYAGTRIKTSRSFCVSRYGRAFTQAEVESWAGLTWAGKIPGTTKTTIFTYRGGYNCRHTLRPISRRAYENFKKNESS